MTVDPKHGHPDLTGVSIPELEEHGHISGIEEGAPYKTMFGAPVSYKAFPSLASGFTFHTIAKTGTISGASLWRVLRETKNTGTIEYANGNADWVNPLDDITSLPYS